MSNAIIIRTNERGQLRAVCRPRRAQRWHIPFSEMNSGVWSSAQEYPERHVATSQQQQERRGFGLHPDSDVGTDSAETVALQPDMVER